MQRAGSAPCQTLAKWAPLGSSNTGRDPTSACLVPLTVRINAYLLYCVQIAGSFQCPGVAPPLLCWNQHACMCAQADVRLFQTLIRFDHVYVVYFKCNRNFIHQMPNLANYVRDMYQTPGQCPPCPAHVPEGLSLHALTVCAFTLCRSRECPCKLL